MKRNIYLSLLISVLTGLVVLGGGATAARPDDYEDDTGYEVWVIDQSNTRDEDGNGTLDSGGTLYIYQGDDLSGKDAASAVPEVLDLGGAARDLCLAQTGTAPVRPHMFFFNGGRTHAVISFVATGHVDTGSNAVVNQFSLVGSVSSDPAPDLMDISPSGNRVFVALRGPNPLTGNNPAFNNAVGSTPGLGIIRVERGGQQGRFFARVPISHIVGGLERADPTRPESPKQKLAKLSARSNLPLRQGELRTRAKRERGQAPFLTASWIS